MLGGNFVFHTDRDLKRDETFEKEILVHLIRRHRPLQRSDLSAVRILPFNWSQERALDIAKQWWNIKAQFRRRASAVPN